MNHLLLSTFNTLIIALLFELFIHSYKYIFDMSKTGVAYGISINHYLLIYYIYHSIIFQVIKKNNWYIIIFLTISLLIFSIYFLDFKYHPYRYSLLVFITISFFLMSFLSIKRNKYSKCINSNDIIRDI